MCAFDKSRNLNYQRLQETGKDIGKAGSDVGDRFRSIKQNAGFYDKVGETLAKIQASQAMLASVQLKFSNRIRWIHELLGTQGISKGPSGIRQALEDDEFKFDIEDIRNSLKDVEAQKEAAKEFKKELLGGADTTDVKDESSSSDKKSGSKADRKLSKDQLNKIETIVNKVYEKADFKVNSKKKRHKPNKESLSRKLERTLMARDPIREHKSLERDLERQIKAKKDELEDSAKAENDYKTIVYILKDVVVKDAEEFIGVFTKKHQGGSGKYQQKIAKIMMTIGSYKSSRSSGAFKNTKRGFKKRDLFALPLAPIFSARRAKKEDRRALKRATESILSDPELGFDANEKKTKTFNKSLDSLANAAEKARKLYLTQSTNQIAGYKRMSEQLIDAFIDLHRNVEKRGSAGKEVIQDNCKKAILLIRRQNRTYFFNEVIRENQKISKDLEDASLVKTDEVGKGPTRERSNAFSEGSTRQRR